MQHLVIYTAPQFLVCTLEIVCQQMKIGHALLYDFQWQNTKCWVIFVATMFEFKIKESKSKYAYFNCLIQYKWVFAVHAKHKIIIIRRHRK